MTLSPPDDDETPTRAEPEKRRTQLGFAFNDHQPGRTPPPPPVIMSPPHFQDHHELTEHEHRVEYPAIASLEDLKRHRVPLGYRDLCSAYVPGSLSPSLLLSSNHAKSLSLPPTRQPSYQAQSVQAD